MKRYRTLVVIVAVLGLLAAACGRDDDNAGNTPGSDPGNGQQTTTTAADDACAGATLEATDIGVSADTITVETMADVGSPLAPGLFQGVFDGMEAYADFVNANGGIGCRQLEVETWDSTLSPDEAKNGLLNACTTAVAMVGGSALFNPDVTTLAECPNQAGEPVGLPDIAAIAQDTNEQCAPNAFIIQAVIEECPVTLGQPRPQHPFVGQTPYYETLVDGPLRGIFLVPGDLPTTIQSNIGLIAAQRQSGIELTDTVKVSGRDEQAQYTPKVLLMKSNGGNYVYNASNDVAMIKMRKEAAAQGGLPDVKVWACSITCYTEELKDAGPVVDDTYLNIQYLPFEEAGENEAVQNFVDSVSDPSSFAASAWQSGMLFKHVVDKIVAEDGPNAITRQAILDELRTTDDFTADGWLGPEPKPLKGSSPCFVLIKLTGGEFERVFPEEKGTFDCDPSNVATVMVDPAAEAGNIQ